MILVKVKSRVFRLKSTCIVKIDLKINYTWIENEDKCNMWDRLICVDSRNLLGNERIRNSVSMKKL